MAVSYDPNLGCVLTFRIRDAGSEQPISEIQFDIELVVAQLKTAPRYDVVYGEPTEVCQIRFDISKLCVGDPHYRLYLTVPNVSRITPSRPDPGVVRLDVGRQWVRPNSGVCFFW